MNLMEGDAHAPRRPDGDRDDAFTVSVPGSASNLGGGFDCIGMAIGRKLTVAARLRAGDGGVNIARSGTVADLDCADDQNLIWQGFVAACAAVERPAPRALDITATSDIPVARGLGSSSAAVVAGAMLANAILHGGLDDAAIIDIAAAIEGHPDNVAPSVLGGAVLSVRSGRQQYHSIRLAVHPSVRFVFAVPDFEVRTSVARAALPESVAFGIAVEAGAHAAALVAGLQTADPALLRAALDDFLHIPFRRALVRAYDAVTGAAVAAGAIGATLSGSGSSIVAVLGDDSGDTGQAVARAMVDTWRSVGVSAESFVTSADLRGATVDWTGELT